jgi:hypothetical protein
MVSGEVRKSRKISRVSIFLIDNLSVELGHVKNICHIYNAFVISCHSRESGNPLFQIHTSSWIPAFAGMTNISVMMTVYGTIIFK